MPPRPRAVAKPAAKKDEPNVSAVDRLADDAAAAKPDAVEAPTEYPAGAPALKPMLAIRPFSKRAEFKRRYAEVAQAKGMIAEAQREVAQIDPKKDEDAHYAAQLRLWAVMDDVYEKVNAALRLAAVDVEAYDAWSDTLEDDNDLMTTFNVYQYRTQPGEARGSTS